MDEISDYLIRPIFRIILGLLRVLQFFAWDVFVEPIGWTIGWCFYRTLSFGHWPQENLTELDRAGVLKSLFIELTGLGVLGLAIFLVTKLLAI